MSRRDPRSSEPSPPAAAPSSPTRSARLEDRHLDRGRLAWLAFGVVALVGGTALGWNGDVITAVATPPALLRAALVGASAVVALALLVRAVTRIEGSCHLASGELDGRDLAGLVRGVRSVFLAVAAIAAAAGWLVGHPLPFVVALVIAGVDVLETSFLLLVVAFRREA